jgi:hypothetical protein
MSTNFLGFVNELTARENRITYERFYVVGCGGDHTLARMVKQLVFWCSRPSVVDAGGWVYRTRDDWRDELMVGEWPVRAALEKLLKLPFIEHDVRKVNGTPKSHYRIKPAEFREWVLAAVTTPHNGPGGNLKVDSEETSRSTLRNHQGPIRKQTSEKTDSNYRREERAPAPARDDCEELRRAVQAVSPRGTTERLINYAVTDLTDLGATGAEVRAFAEWYTSEDGKAVPIRSPRAIKDFIGEYRCWLEDQQTELEVDLTIHKRALAARKTEVNPNIRKVKILEAVEIERAQKRAGKGDAA